MVKDLKDGCDIGQVSCGDEDRTDDGHTGTKANSHGNKKSLWKVSFGVRHFLSEMRDGIKARKSPITSADTDVEGNPIRPAGHVPVVGEKLLGRSLWDIRSEQTDEDDEAEDDRIDHKDEPHLRETLFTQIAQGKENELKNADSRHLANFIVNQEVYPWHNIP